MIRINIVKPPFLVKISADGNGVDDAEQSADQGNVQNAGAAAPQQPTSPFRMPSFAAKPSSNVGNSGGAGSGLFQKGAMSSPFARPRVATAVPRMPTFGRVVEKQASSDDDEIVLRPYKPKDA